MLMRSCITCPCLSCNMLLVPCRIACRTTHHRQLCPPRHRYAQPRTLQRCNDAHDSVFESVEVLHLVVEATRLVNNHQPSPTVCAVQHPQTMQHCYPCLCCMLYGGTHSSCRCAHGRHTKRAQRGAFCRTSWPKRARHRFWQRQMGYWACCLHTRYEGACRARGCHASDQVAGEVQVLEVLVAATHRRRGIGRAMMEAMCACYRCVCHREGCLSC